MAIKYSFVSVALTCELSVRWFSILTRNDRQAGNYSPARLFSYDEAVSSVMSESREIRVPADLCLAAEKKFGGLFSSVDELVAFLLQELVQADTVDLDRAEQAVVEQRLRDLGYI
jgi:hypothetical protein